MIEMMGKIDITFCIQGWLASKTGNDFLWFGPAIVGFS
jgi:hypothetical protein